MAAAARLPVGASRDFGPHDGAVCATESKHVRLHLTVLREPAEEFDARFVVEKPIGIERADARELEFFGPAEDQA